MMRQATPRAHNVTFFFPPFVLLKSGASGSVSTYLGRNPDVGTGEFLAGEALEKSRHESEQGRGWQQNDSQISVIRCMELDSACGM